MNIVPFGIVSPGTEVVLGRFDEEYAGDVDMEIGVKTDESRDDGGFITSCHNGSTIYVDNDECVIIESTNFDGLLE